MPTVVLAATITCPECGSPSRPAPDGGDVFRYRLHSPDGDDLGEATYAMMIKPGEEIIADQSAVPRRRRRPVRRGGRVALRRAATGRGGIRAGAASRTPPTALAHSGSGQRRRYADRVR